MKPILKGRHAVALSKCLRARNIFLMSLLFWCRVRFKIVFCLGAPLVKKIIFIIVLCSIAPLAYSHDSGSSDQLGIGHILESYSERTGVKFVTDPRVSDHMKANMLGLDINELTQTNLIDILISLDIVPYEKDGVVYLHLRQVLEVVLQRLKDSEVGYDYGELWGS